MRVLVLALALAVSSAGCYGGETRGADDDLNLAAGANPRDGGWDLSATMTNTADDRSYDFRRGCEHEWDWSLAGPGGAVPLGLAQCQGFTETELGPGESVPFAFFWDGTQWDDDSGTYVDSPAGTYTFDIAFLYQAGQQTERVPLRILFEHLG